MRLFKTLLLVVVMCMVLPTHTLAQNTSTQGKEFWLTFMHNGFKEHPLGGWITNQVLISAKRDCSGTISNPKTGWSVQFNVNANSITTVDIPIEQGYHDRSNYSTVSKKAIHIVSTDTISAYCTNIAYVLRRFVCAAHREPWRRLHHPKLQPIEDVFGGCRQCQPNQCLCHRRYRRQHRHRHHPLLYHSGWNACRPNISDYIERR